MTWGIMFWDLQEVNDERILLKRSLRLVVIVLASAIFVARNEREAESEVRMMMKKGRAEDWSRIG